MVDLTPKAIPPAYIDSLHPREWVIRAGGDWRLADGQRDWGGVHEVVGSYFRADYTLFIAIAFPGNGKHEYLGTFKTAGEAKAAVEARLA